MSETTTRRTGPTPSSLRISTPSAAQVLLKRREIRQNFREWCLEALSEDGLKPARHQLLLIQELSDLAHGVTDRLMILMPPGAAKSTYSSKLFPPWFFAKFPNANMIACSHTEDLAERFSKEVRRSIERHSAELGYTMAADARKIDRWGTSLGGEYKMAGVTGAIAGSRADVALIDDPIRSFKDAESQKYRDAVWDWYRADLVTRLKPSGRIALIMTRWHQDDLAGRLLKDDPDGWRVLRLPAIADDPDDPIGRQIGEALWPEWEPLEALERKRREVGTRTWEGLFQQNPKPGAGALFDITKLEVVEAAPNDIRFARGWDLAATEQVGANNPDWTVGIKLGVSSTGRLYITDLRRVRASPAEVERILKATAEQDGPRVSISIPEDPGQAGKAQTLHYGRLLAGYKVTFRRPTGSKVVRATPIAAQIEAGNVSVVRARWNEDFYSELRDFWTGPKDDQVDALSDAHAELTGHVPAQASRRLRLNIFGR